MIILVNSHKCPILDTSNFINEVKNTNLIVNKIISVIKIIANFHNKIMLC